MIGGKSKYDLMSPGEVTDSNGNYYPDLTSFPINDFVPSVKGRPYNMVSVDPYRIDLKVGAYYGSFDYYDLMTLWLNDIPYLADDDYIGTDLYFFQKQDLDAFYLDKLVEQ
jgi:hypothetical protein